jgi:hypothetical protein
MISGKILLSIVGVVVGVGIVAYVFVLQDAPMMGVDGEGVATQEKMGGEEMEVQSFSGTGSFAELMSRGIDMSCTFSSDFNGAVTTGTMYFGDGAYRMSSESTVSGMQIVSNIIYTNEKTYTWTETPQGAQAFVMDSVAPVPAQNTQVDPDMLDTQMDTTVQNVQGTQMDMHMTYDCSPWAVDTSYFVPPSDIEFVDMQSLMQQYAPQ